MKSALAIAAVLGLLLPAAAAADPSDCGRLMYRINHFEGMIARAEEAGREDWAGKTQAHVELLETQLADRCPSFSARDEQQEAARQLALLLKIAATAAAKFFTFGAY
ncbi:MAG: hypothetical protein JRD03_09715 [Deltaproteobacteria bacterium]|nr:hypothetical protein [Deltaproteobacteria bacterium]